MKIALKTPWVRSVALIFSILAFFAGLTLSPYCLFLLLPLLLFKGSFNPLNNFFPKDEREILLGHKIGHLSFFVTYTLILLLFLWKSPHFKTGIPAEWILLLSIPPGFYYFGDLALLKGFRKSGLAIGWIFGGFWLLFTLVSHGFTSEGLVESSIGGGILLTTLLAQKWPALGGSLFLLEGLFFLSLYLRSGLASAVKFLMLVILALPLFLSGIFILSEKLQSEETD